MDYIENEFSKLNTSIKKIDKTIKLITELKYDKNLSDVEFDTCLEQLNTRREELINRQDSLCNIMVEAAEAAAYEDGLISSLDI